MVTLNTKLDPRTTGPLVQVQHYLNKSTQEDLIYQKNKGIYKKKGLDVFQWRFVYLKETSKDLGVVVGHEYRRTSANKSKIIVLVRKLGKPTDKAFEYLLENFLKLLSQTESEGIKNKLDEGSRGIYSNAASSDFMFNENS